MVEMHKTIILKCINLSFRMLKPGDAVVFPSHKYHCVQPVKEGTRQVMILELW